MTPASDKVSRPAFAVAVSGGPDSMALLWAAWRVASPLGLRTLAFHVHHGLQPAADAWPQLVGEECRRWAVAHPEHPPISVLVEHIRSRPPRGESVEDWARRVRYKALTRMAHAQGLNLVLLGHHRRDQAETFLLQALRGAGPQGLAAMPRLQWRDGVCLARPWLDQPRERVRALAQVADVSSVNDPSNEDPRFARNRLRQLVWPALVDAFDAVEPALALSAQRCAQALESLEAGARADTDRCFTRLGGPGWQAQVNTRYWMQLSPARRSWVVRTWLSDGDAVLPATVVDQIAGFDFAATTTMRWSVDADRELRWYRGTLELGRARPVRKGTAQAAAGLAVSPPPAISLRLGRAGTRPVAAWGGALVLRRAAMEEGGWAVALPVEVCLRPRRGEDQFQRSPRGAARSLKKQFQSAGVPAWSREGPVVTAADGTVLMVPGLGMDARATVPGGRWVLEWRADSAAGQE